MQRGIRMPMLMRAIAILLALSIAPIQSHAAQANAAPSDPVPLILVSIDGFRADYLDRGITPTLSAVAAAGTRAERMTPSFPSVTFPNHTTLVTGLYPDHHGIVNNRFTDPALPGVFTMASKDAGWWAQGTPIWITAEQAGMPTGVMFWPGVAVPHAGVTPGLFKDFNPAITPEGRVDTVLGWLDLPAPKTPHFLTLYFEAVDSAGHHHGPDSPEVNAALASIDAAIGRLVAGLKARGLAANLIVVADHGMAAVGPDNVVLLDDLIGPASGDLAGATVVFDGTIVGIAIPATPAGEAARRRLLSPHPHMQCWNKGAIPAALHYGTNPRVPDVVCQVATGWLALTRDERARTPTLEKGAHGYAIDDPAMGALFIAQGPAFRAGTVIPPFPNVDVYPLMAKVLGITPLPNDGNLADVTSALAPK
eukprot:gene7777-7843_t